MHSRRPDHSARSKGSTKTALYDGFAGIGLALASGRRLEILDVLAQGVRSVQEIADEVGLTVANTSQHLQLLTRAGFVYSERSGRHVLYGLTGPEIADLLGRIRSLAIEHIDTVAGLTQRHVGNRSDVRWISRSALAGRLTDMNIVLLDVRPVRDFVNGRIRGARSMPASLLPGELDRLRRDATVVVYCRSDFCALGDRAYAVLAEAGLDVLRLTEGFPEWRAAGLPIAVG